MPEQKPIKFTELFHFSEPTNAKIKLNRNNTTFPAWISCYMTIPNGRS